MAKNIFRRPGRQGWYIRVIHDGKTIIRGSFSTTAAAQIALATLRRDLERGDLGLAKKCRTPLRQFAEDRYIPWARLHKRTWETDRLTLQANILPKLGSLTLSEISRTRVERYLSDRLAAVKPASANREAALLRRMMGLAVEWNLIDENPIRRLNLFPESPPRCPILSSEDEFRILKACQPWLLRIVQAALLTGARQGELLALKWRHIDFDNGLMVIEDSKTGHPRSVPLHPHLAELLRAVRGLPEGFVFVLDGKPVQVKHHSCSQAFRRLVRHLKLPLRFHDLRHIAASRMLSGGAGVLQIADILGHKTLAMTRRYSHVSIADRKAAIANLQIADVSTSGSASALSA